MSLLSTVPPAEQAPDWLVPLRKSAAAALSEGLPTKKTEAWRFTKVSHLIDSELETAVVEQSAGFATLGDAWRVFVHAGRPVVGPNVPADVHASTGLDGEVPELGTIARDRHFTALNTASFHDVLVLRVSGRVERTVEIEYGGTAGVAYPRVLIVLEKGASLRLVERTSGESAISVAVTEVIVGQGARLDHTRIHQDRGNFIGTLAVRLERDAFYHSHVFSVGGALMRLNLDVALHGPGAECWLDGVYHAAGKEVIDHHVRVDHLGPHCTSHQRYRGVLDEKGTAVFDGQAIVHRSAPASEAHQENRNLLLSDSATVHTKPHLEIDHDEVVASHGATVGALDLQSLFYLRSRGVPRSLAEGILTLGFLRELLAEIPDETLREDLIHTLVSRLPESDALRSFETGSLEP